MLEPKDETVTEGGGQQAAPLPLVRKIAVCGTSMSTFADIPVHEPDWEIWTWGHGAAGPPPRITRYFELHRYDIVAHQNPPFTKKLETVGFPIYTFAPVPQWPTHKILPRARLEDRFGKEFLNSQAAWALAQAIDELRPQEFMHLWHQMPGVIGVFGIDAALAEEYEYQRQAIQHFVRLGRELGLDVGIAADSDLHITWPTYPDNMDGQLGARMVERRHDLRRNRAEIAKSLKALELELARYDAKLEEMEWHCKYHGIYDAGRRNTGP